MPYSTPEFSVEKKKAKTIFSTAATYAIRTAVKRGMPSPKVLAELHEYGVKEGFCNEDKRLKKNAK